MSGRELLRSLLSLLAAFAVATVLFNYWFSRGRVDGDFMPPLLLDGDAIVVERASGRFFDYRVGEIVSLPDGGDSRDRLLARVIASPGDQVLAGGTQLRLLGPDEFVIADDLAQHGRTVLERGDIEGRVLLRAWPPERFKWRPGVE